MGTMKVHNVQKMQNVINIKNTLTYNLFDNKMGLIVP